MLKLKTATEKDFGKMESIAREVWHETFDPIIGEKQVDYMLKRFQCFEAFVRQTLAEGYTYHLFCEDGKTVGYIALVNEDSERLFLSKLYLLTSARGKGYGKIGLDFAVKEAKAANKAAVYLTVNKQNSHAVAVYEKCGFERVDSIVTDIGNGFVMDDFVYEKRV